MSNVDMTGRVCMVTGATNGIGEATARELARMGATVVIAGRNEDKALRVTAEIKTATGNPNVTYVIGDLSALAGMRRVAEAFLAKHDQLHVLVNNAGAFFTSYQKTEDGHEKTFALNHLSYFLVTHLLLGTLKASGTPERKARIINVSSDAHQAANSLDFDNLQAEKGYNSFGAYGKSKLENIMFTYELARRLQAEGANVTTNALNPGPVATGFGYNNGPFTKLFLNMLRPFALSAEQGAQTSIYLASSPEVEDVTGKYFNDSKQKASNRASMDEAKWQRLWEISEVLTGIKVPAI